MVVFNNFNQGRLGNQLFFVAATIGIATNNNTTYGFTSNMGHSGIDYQSIFKNPLPITTLVPIKKHHQENFNYSNIVINDDVEIIGYFQSEKFFKHCKDLITEQFEFKDKIIDLVKGQHPEIVNSCSLHIRRGDYVNQPNHHPVTPIEYYSKILNEISSEYDKIFIFSDDEEWVKNEFKGDKYIFPSFNINNDLYSFVLMSLSKDNIICNSTYSWWAAWLNKNKNKKIYSPEHTKWFGPMYDNLETKDVLPDEWIKIKY
jgi:hypothetical protein